MKRLLIIAATMLSAAPAMAWPSWHPKSSGYENRIYRVNPVGTPQQYLGQPGPAIRSDRSGSYCSTPNIPQWCIQR